jgi:hypothetical protein
MDRKYRMGIEKCGFVKYGEFIYDSLKDCFMNEHIQKRIFPLVAETSTSFPFITYTRNDMDFSPVTKDNTLNNITYTISVISDSYLITLNYIQKLFNYYQFAFFTNEKIKTQVISTSENYQDGAFVQNITINLINN